MPIIRGVTSQVGSRDNVPVPGGPGGSKKGKHRPHPAVCGSAARDTISKLKRGKKKKKIIGSFNF